MSSVQNPLFKGDFEQLEKNVLIAFEKSKASNAGKVADYIPQLAKVSSELFSVSVCTVGGETVSLGDKASRFCIQSVSKPINYALALEENGVEFVHRHIGHEPSGLGFNELSLNKEGKPHNPMINSGAIMCASLIKPRDELADRFESVLVTWKKLSGDESAVTFNNSVYLSERKTADRNFALGYFMKEKKTFPENTDLLTTLEFYFQCCSIELDVTALARVASVFANGGVNPKTGDRIFSRKTTQHVLSLMYSCGMYDYSGTFAFETGIPAKSGVSGALMVVIPGKMGMAIYSPRVDSFGNSVRGIAFCKELKELGSFHHFA